MLPGADHESPKSRTQVCRTFARRELRFAPRKKTQGLDGKGPKSLASYSRVGEAFVSRGHFAGRWTAEVLVNEIARSSYVDRRVGAQFPVGSVLVKKHRDRLSSAPGPVFIMIKRDPGTFAAGGDSEYVVTDPDGSIADRGALAACARCHAEANSDWTFGPPRSALGAPPQAGEPTRP